MAPEGIENSIIGSVVAACTKATMSFELAMVAISPPAPTVCTMVPRLEITPPSHSKRKTGLESGPDKDDFDIGRFPRPRAVGPFQTKSQIGPRSATLATRDSRCLAIMLTYTSPTRFDAVDLAQRPRFSGALSGSCALWRSK